MALASRREPASPDACTEGVGGVEYRRGVRDIGEGRGRKGGGQNGRWTGRVRKGRSRLARACPARVACAAGLLPGKPPPPGWVQSPAENKPRATTPSPSPAAGASALGVCAFGIQNCECKEPWSSAYVRHAQAAGGACARARLRRGPLLAPVLVELLVLVPAVAEGLDGVDVEGILALARDGRLELLQRRVTKGRGCAGEVRGWIRGGRGEERGKGPGRGGNC